MGEMADFSELLLNTNHCNSTSPYSPHQKNIILLIMGGTGILSVLTCVIAVMSVFCLCLVKQFSYRLAVYQVMATLFYSISMSSVLLLLNYDNRSLFSVVSCKIVAFIIHYSMWIKLLFTLWLSFHLFSYVVFLKNFQKLEIVYVTTSVLLPLIHAWIPFIHNKYGLVGAWCYIRTWKDDCESEKDLQGIVEVFTLFYGPIIISLILNTFAIFIMFVVMLRRVYKDRQQENVPLLTTRHQKLQALKHLLPLLAYPIIYLFLLISPLIDRIYDAVSRRPSYALVIAHVFTGSLMGVFAGSALLIHVCYLQTSKIKRDTPRETLTRNKSSPYLIIETNTAVPADTHYSVPNESKVDAEYGRALRDNADI